VLLETPARWLLACGLRPNHVTFAALLIGLGAGLTLYFGLTALAAALLWVSGFLDAVDGSMARQSGTSSIAGAWLDILCDRVVELSILWALALRHPESMYAMLGLLTAIFLNITVFLATGMLAPKSGNKSFYYQPGLMERTEGFIMFTAMMLFTGRLAHLAWIFAALCGITTLQRLAEAFKLMKPREKTGRWQA